MTPRVEQPCPVCECPDLDAVLERVDVPVHQNLLYSDEASALAARRGDIDLCSCRRCGFVFNRAFDPDLVEYGPKYENSQHHSAAFVAHLDALAGRIITEHALSTGRVVEVGCGKGDFLLRLARHPGSQIEAVGFDPSYLGPTEMLDGRVRFVADFYGPGSDVTADVLVSRHVIEHIPDPMALLHAMRDASIAGRTRVFVETPCVDWILRHSVLWDFFYEHCSLFTAHSLGLALTRAGFRVTEVRHVFDGQYLWAEAETADGDWPDHSADDRHDLLDIARFEQARLDAWHERLTELNHAGRLVLWGAGAKGLTFGNLVDPDRTLLDAVADVNPAKQGQYVGGTGHPIIAPEAVRGAASVIVLNPNYVAEIRELMAGIDAGTQVLDWMENT